MNLVAQGGQQGNGDRPHTAGGTGDQDRAIAGLDIGILQRQHAQHGGVTRGADRHGLLVTEGVGYAYDPLRPDALLLAVSPVEGLRHAVTVDQYPVPRVEGGIARFHHGAGQVDAAYQWQGATDRRRTGHRQAILVVQRGTGHVDQYRFVGQVPH